MKLDGVDVWVKFTPEKRPLYISGPLLQSLPAQASTMMSLPDSQFDIGSGVLQVFRKEGTDLISTSPDVLCANYPTIRADLQAILSFLNQQNCIHRDIKPDNLIWTGAHVKLIDLDNMIRLREGEEYRDTTFGGSEEYIPEDAIHGRFAIEEGYSAATDAYAVKLTLENIEKLCKPQQAARRAAHRAARRRLTKKSNRRRPKTRKYRVKHKHSRKH
jgi:serine/threonine protein kinase